MSYQGLFFVAKSVFSTGESRSSTEADNKELLVVDIHIYLKTVASKKLSQAFFIIKLHSKNFLDASIKNNCIL